MSTNATIAYREPDGDHWVGTYNHWDGDSLKPRIEAAIEAQGAEAVRDLIDATPQGFSFFDPAGSSPSTVFGTALHEVISDWHNMTERGRGLQQGAHEYTYIIELDGTVTAIGERA